MTTMTEKLAGLLANTYAVYLKTQNYHWHVKGLHFKALHDLFEEQYTALAMAVDEIAERIRTLGAYAPASFTEFNQLKTIADGDAKASAEKMVDELHHDHLILVQQLNEAFAMASELGDEGTVALLSERIAAHEKMGWMLAACKG